LAMLMSRHQPPTTQEKMAEVLTSVPAQMAYNLAKGSVPVRNDIDVNALDACARDSWSTFADPKALRVPSLAHRMAADEAVKDAVAQILWRFTTLNLPINDTQARLATVMQRPKSTG
jgi:glucose/mannose transport system substrate-binding protein